MSNLKATIIATINPYQILATSHSLKRMRERRIDRYQVISAITSIGLDTIAKYRANKTDVMVMDRTNGFSVVFCVAGNQVRIITVIDSGDCYVKPDTAVEILN